MVADLINELLKELDPCLEYTGHEIDGDILRLFVQTTRSDAVCPRCGQTSAKRHSVYPKKFRDLPVLGKKVEIVMMNRVMFCENPQCSKSTFAERFSFTKPFGRKTDRLWEKIEDIALNTSSVQASATLRDGIADVGKSTLCAREKQPPPMVDPADLVFLGVDDWAKHKGETYGTIVVDMLSNRVVNLIDSREKKPVAEELKRYINVVAVNRDGSRTYHAAIDSALPDAVQMSDCFHLLKGLTEALKPHVRSMMPGSITISSDSSISPRWISTRPENAHERKTREKEEAKAERHCRIVELKEEGYTVHQIAVKVGVCDATVRKNLSSTFTPADARTGSSSGRGEIARYAAKVCSLYERGLPMTEILEEIKKDGFGGGYYAIQNFIAREKRRRTAAAIQGNQTVIDRKKALAMLYNQKKAPLTKEEVNAIAGIYPEYGMIIGLVRSFLQLFTDRDMEGLEGWLQRAAELDIAGLNSFVNGVRQDLDAVLAAILLGMTSGAVEGSVNKLKVFKRVMYGRCSFELLRGKLLLYEDRKARRQPCAKAA